jgi:N utilization substance protein A
MEPMFAVARHELLQVADAVAREKSIERDQVLEAMEQAIQKAGRSKYGHEHDIRATIDRKTGDIALARYREVVEEVEDEHTQIPLKIAKKLDPEKNVGDFIVDELPPIDFGRIAAQTAKQVIVQKVREAERMRQHEEYKDRKGEIVQGLVKRVEFGNITVDFGRAEALLRRDEALPRESFRKDDRVRALIIDVREEPRGPQIFLSRSHPDFMAKLFAQEVPEIYDGIIEIKAVARDPGSRAKIAVISNDSSIDPVGACVGMRGSRVQAVVGELQGEKIDIIPWSPDPATFVVNALAPAEVAKVVLDEDAGRIEVVVPDDQLSLAIGRRGQNVRLASILTGWDIDILTEAEESERRNEEFKVRSQMFIDALDVDDVIAHLLVTEGFTRVEEVAFIPVDDLSGIEGFDEEVAEELRNRARTFLSERDERNIARRKELGVTDEVAALEGLNPAMLVALGENGVKTLDDFADLSTDELVDPNDGILKDHDMSREDADALIMGARAHWFADDPTANGAGDETSSKATAEKVAAEPQG